MNSKNTPRYDTSNGLRGFAFIFSHRNFDDSESYPPRIGVDHDIEQLAMTLNNLGLTVRNYYDLTLRKTFNEIDKSKYLIFYYFEVLSLRL